MTLPRARVLRAGETGELTPISVPTAPGLPRGRVVTRDVVEASERARAIVADAERRRDAVLEQAVLQSADVRIQAEAQGRADGVAAVAAQALALASLEARADERSLERVVALARMLAERLLGEELRLAPERVVALARQALGEARGARRVRLVAHPDDVALLERSLPELGIEPDVITLAADPARARAELRLETEIGVLDAELGPQLDRLTERLKRSLPR
jgi:flagellar biosynthesis/type III secretory pathway protein FliH